jgi:hypothetical protein
MAKLIECERGRDLIVGEDDALVANGERHLAQPHPDLVGTLSREQILANVKEA